MWYLGWRPRQGSTDLCVTISGSSNPLAAVTLKSLRTWEYEPILLRGTDKMILIYTYHKPFKVQLPNKHEQQNGFNSDNMEA
jgi:hypothetical protein